MFPTISMFQIQFFKFNKVRIFYTDEAYGQSLSADLQVRGGVRDGGMEGWRAGE